MRKPAFAPIILAFLVVFLLFIIPNQWIESLIPNSRVSEAATGLNPTMFQGKFIQTKMLEDKHYLPMYGSSELARLDAFHPSNYFQVTGQPYTPFLVGRGGTEDLIHLLNFSEHIDQLKGRKIIFVLSPQWFQPRGTDESHFVPNYSTLQGYDFAFNNTINPAVKKMAIKRLLKFTPVKNDIILSTLYKAEISNNSWDQRKADFVRPIGYVYKALLEKKDLYYSIAGSAPLYKREISPKLKGMSWSQLASQAELEGAKSATNNKFYIINSQYDKMKKSVPSLKNTRLHSTYGKGPEYHDFQLVLDVLKQAGAKPLFISVPCNGPWYDYIGFPKSGREAYYTRIKKQVQAEGFQIADFSNHENDPYFLKDTIHIGWKGWVYTDRAILDFMKNGNGKNKKVVQYN